MRSSESDMIRAAERSPHLKPLRGRRLRRAGGDLSIFPEGFARERSARAGTGRGIERLNDLSLSQESPAPTGLCARRIVQAREADPSTAAPSACRRAPTTSPTAGSLTRGSPEGHGSFPAESARLRRREQPRLGTEFLSRSGPDSGALARFRDVGPRGQRATRWPRPTPPAGGRDVGRPGPRRGEAAVGSVPRRAGGRP